MNQTPTHETEAGRAYLALRQMAKREARLTDELLQLYALEGFVDRLASSRVRSKVVLKGGVLLQAYDVRRPTRDVDLAATAVSNEPAVIQDLVAAVLAEPRSDGFEYGALSSEVIREQDTYSGVRVTVPCTLATARLSFHVDVNVGDVISPSPRAVELPRLLGGAISIQGYPLSMVFAEKLVTAVARGTANTRWRDFADVFLLARRHSIGANELTESMHRVAQHRGARLAALSEVLVGYGELAQRKWSD